MAKKIVVVGGVAGGASAAARARRLDESAEIVMFERGPNVSFSNCALPFFVSRIVPQSENLVLMTPEQFKKQYNIIAKTAHEVIKINAAAKTVTVKDAAGKDLNVVYRKGVYRVDWNSVCAENYVVLYRRNVVQFLSVLKYKRYKL